jgi:hypothetical protein
MATYQFPQHFGYSQQQSDGSYPSSSSDQQHQQQQHNQQQQYQNQNQHQQAGNNFSANDYYGFTGNSAQYQQQTQAYFGQSTNGVNQISLNDNGHVSGNGNGHDHGYNAPQPQFMNPNYDPFELGVPTGTGMYFNPSMQYIQPQLFFNQQQQQQQQQATTNYLHRPTHEQSNISPNGSIPGSAQSSHLNLQSITPERQPTRTPEDDTHGSPLPTSLTGPTRSTQLGRQKEGPVKAACLSCRQKKAKCDGAKPICTQVSLTLRSLQTIAYMVVYQERNRVCVCEIETRWSQKEA